MKKLMTTMLAVAVGVGLHAAGMADTGTSFEGLDAGAYDITATTGELSAQEAGQTFWVTNGTETLTVVAGTSVTAEYDNPGTPSRPAQYIDNSSSQGKYLSIKTTLGNPVTRNVSVGGTGTSIGDGFYFDSLVKFTAFEGDQAVDLNGGKLAIWLQENLGANDEPVSTNLVVTAGFLDELGGVVATNYSCNVAGVNLSDGGWHRVTVKAIATIYSGDTVPGFVVYVDGVSATSADAKGIDTSALTDNADAFNALGALFPSADQSSGAISTISSVAFDGQGDVDDLVFTATAPDFAKDNEFFTIELGENVESLTYSMYGMGLSETISETTRIQYTAGMGVTVSSVTYAPNYMAAGITASSSVTLSEGYYFPGAAEQSITVNAKVAGAAINGVGYETVTAAFAAISAGTAGAGPFTVVMNASATSGVELNSASAEVVLDLAGNNITGAVDQAAITVTAGSLLITNTTETIGHVIAVQGSEESASPVAVDDGTLVVAGGYYDGLMPFNGYTITGGGIRIAENSGNLEDLQDCVIDGYMLQPFLGGSYYVVVEKPVARTWTVTFLNDGDTYDTVEVEDGQVCVLPDAPTKEHYTFAGWYPYNIGALQPYDFTQPITADVTVEAHYTADTYTVSFDTAGGDVMPAIPDQSVTYNEYADDPNVTPVKEHYLFKWWSADASSEFVFASTPIVANTQLTAVYTAAVYTVTFMVDGSLYDTKTAEYNTTLAVLPENPTKAECVFTGWSTNSTAEGVVDLESFLITGTTELNAIWTVLPPTEKYEPGESGITPPQGKTAAEFAADINANKANYIDTPSTTDVANTANYLALFHAVADTEADTVSIELTTGAYEIEQIAANATAAAIVSDLSAATVEITAQPGLWYSISSGSTLTGMTEGTRVMATDSNLSEGKLTLTLPETTGTGFYKVNVNLADKPAPVPNP